MHKVLVVDDDAQLLTILKEGLKKYSNRFEIMTVQDGLAAIMALKEQAFSLVVTEIRIPIVNGLVLLAYIRNNYPKTPCIVMTGHGTPFLRRRLEHELACYLEKPFRVMDLGQTIMSVLSQQVAFGGVMKGISLAGFVQLVEGEHMSCLCEVSSLGINKGYLLFDGGVLSNAFYGSLRGEEAALKLLQMEDATIRFKEPPQKRIPRQIETKLSGLLAKAKRVEKETEQPEEKRRVGAPKLTEK
jgi:CheY-like chemotaxis protein